jgi:hypothetical protein
MYTAFPLNAVIQNDVPVLHSLKCTSRRKQNTERGHDFANNNIGFNVGEKKNKGYFTWCLYMYRKLTIFFLIIIKLF